MTAPRDPDRLIDAFLDEGLNELPDPVYDAVRDRIEQTRKGAGIGPGRTFLLSNAMKWGIAAAAVVVTVIVGFQFLGDSGLGGPAATATPEPTATPAASTPTAGGLPVGSSFAWLDGSDGAVPVTVTIPAAGWSGTQGFFALEKNGESAPPDAVAVLAFTDRQGWTVPGDGCNWESTLPDAPSATIDAFVAALSAQAGRDASAPVDITVDGYAGKSIRLHVPSDLAYRGTQFPDCDGTLFCQWFDPELGAATTDSCSRTAYAPRQIDELWIVQVNDLLVVIDAAYFPETPVELVDEERAIVDSIRFE
jgi:hypothetical protein